MWISSWGNHVTHLSPSHTADTHLNVQLLLRLKLIKTHVAFVVFFWLTAAPDILQLIWSSVSSSLNASQREIYFTTSSFLFHRNMWSWRTKSRFVSPVLLKFLWLDPDSGLRSVKDCEKSNSHFTNNICIKIKTKPWSFCNPALTQPHTGLCSSYTIHPPKPHPATCFPFINVASFIQNICGITT